MLELHCVLDRVFDVRVGDAMFTRFAIALVLLQARLGFAQAPNAPSPIACSFSAS
jgi:hypothetical protein